MSAFAKVDNGVVESQLVGFFIDGLFHDYLKNDSNDGEILNLSSCCTIYNGRTKFKKKVSVKNS